MIGTGLLSWLAWPLPLQRLSLRKLGGNVEYPGKLIIACFRVAILFLHPLAEGFKMSRYGGYNSRVPNDCKVYIGDLPKDASEKEVEKAFSYYGRLRSVWVARNPPGFAFVEFEDHRDADDSVKELDGKQICGVRVRVELSSGKVRPKPWLRGSRGPPRNRRAFNPDDRCYECGDRGHYAYDCPRNYRSKGGAGHSRRRSRSYSRSYSRSRSRDRRRDTRSKSRSRSPYADRSRSRSRSPPPKSRSRSRSPSANSN